MNNRFNSLSFIHTNSLHALYQFTNSLNQPLPSEYKSDKSISLQVFMVFLFFLYYASDPQNY